MINSRVGLNNYKPYKYCRLDTAGSGQSIAVLGKDDSEVAFNSNSAENSGTMHPIIVHLKDVLHAR